MTLLWHLWRLVEGGSSSLILSFLELPANVVPQEGSYPQGSFLRRKLVLGKSLYWGIPASVWDLVRRCISYDFVDTSFVYTKERKICRGFQVEASRAYAFKLILGLGHLPPWMVPSWWCGKKPQVRKKYRASVGNSSVSIRLDGEGDIYLICLVTKIRFDSPNV